MRSGSAQEESWHSDTSFATPAKERLRQQLRTRRLKCEMVEQPDRRSAGDVLVEAAASHNSDTPLSLRRPAKVWEPKPLATISGLPVFGPQLVGGFKGSN